MIRVNKNPIAHFMRNHTKPRTIGNYFVDIIILKKKLNASFFDRKDKVERIRVKL